MDTSSYYQSIEADTKTTIELTFTFISVVSLLTAIAGLACLPGALTALAVAAICIICCPLLGIIHFAANVIEQMCNTFFNIFWRLQNVINGNFAELTRLLHRKLRINDSPDVEDQFEHTQQNGQGSRNDNGDNQGSAETHGRQASNRIENAHRPSAEDNVPQEDNSENHDETESQSCFDTRGFNPLG